MLFYSPHANFQVICSKTRIIRHQVTGEEIDRVPGIWANFGKLGPSYQFTNPETGEEMTGASITGHFYDTDLEAAQNGWDDETKRMVETKLLRLCQTQPDRIQRREREVPKAELPWATYDDATVEQILEIAPLVGAVDRVLAYERENRDRPAITQGFASQPAVVDDEFEPAPAVEPEPVAVGDKVGEPLLRTISL